MLDKVRDLTSWSAFITGITVIRAAMRLRIGQKRRSRNGKNGTRLLIIAICFLRRGTLVEGDYEKMEKEIDLIMEEAVAFADRSAFPDVNEIYTDIYAA